MPSLRYLSFLLVLALAACAAPGSTPAPTNTAAPTHTAAPTRTPQPTITPTLGVGSSYINPVDGARLLYVPAGEFEMGTEDGEGDEQPVHTVYLDAYWMYETEVTNAQFAQFVAETSYRTDAEHSGLSRVWTGVRWNKMDGAYWEHPTGPSSNLNGLEDYPVIHVSWNDAVAYCVWAGVRLPTEAEWEKAARGTDGRTYPWGDTWNWLYSNSSRAGDGVYGDTAPLAPVGSYPGGASPYGLLDMTGNVWEWVADRYDSNYYSNSPASNPQGPSSGEYRVLRGSSWYDSTFALLSAFRLSHSPSTTSDDFGFRCASSTAP